MAAVLIAELSPYRSETVSQFWAACFPAGTLVSTPGGMRPIETLGVGEQVIDARGEATVIKETMVRPFTGDLVTLDLLGTLPLTASAEHPILVRRGGREQWLEAARIGVGDCLVLPRSRCSSEPALRFDATAVARGRQPLLGKPLALTPDVAYLLGRFVGDGAASLWVERALYDRGRVEISFDLGEEEEAEICLGVARGAFGSAGLRQGNETYRVSFGRGTVGRCFQEWFGHLAHNKRLPASVTGLEDPETIRSFLRGYFDTDGHIVKAGKSAGTINASSASPGLVLQLQALCTKLGCCAALHRQLRKETTGSIRGRTFQQRVERYMLSVPKSEVALIYPGLHATFNRTARKIVRGEQAWYLPVKRVLRQPVVDRPVYNLHTAANTYLVQNLAVHNCGIDVVLTEEVDPETGETHIVGTGRSRRAEHLVDRTYIDRDGKEQVRKSITYVPRLKTKMLGVLGPSFLRAGGHYAEVYRGYKHRWEQHPKWGLAAQERGEPGATAMHRHRAALRYCVKMFLQDLFIAWRKLEGLPIREPYAVEKLGMPPHESAVAQDAEAGKEQTG
jgi:hypothetical protein